MEYQASQHISAQITTYSISQPNILRPSYVFCARQVMFSATFHDLAAKWRKLGSRHQKEKTIDRWGGNCIS